MSQLSQENLLRAEYRLTEKDVKSGLRVAANIQAKLPIHPTKFRFLSKRMADILYTLLIFIGIILMGYQIYRSFGFILLFMVIALCLFVLYKIWVLPVMRRSEVAKKIAALKQNYAISAENGVLKVLEGVSDDESKKAREYLFHYKNGMKIYSTPDCFLIADASREGGSARHGRLLIVPKRDLGQPQAFEEEFARQLKDRYIVVSK